ncbi:MAG: hypothetical protein JSS86_21170 [Cyanobacteria bacterium SZAS LIN-2]|nr:hypothetical protein [Cyanobacteria bacterium SZAS LIN-2]
MSLIDLLSGAVEFFGVGAGWRFFLTLAFTLALAFAFFYYDVPPFQNNYALGSLVAVGFVTGLAWDIAAMNRRRRRFE